MAARSLSTWYTVRSDTDGMPATTAACTDSAVGCSTVSCSTRNTAWRCGVILRPLARKAVVSSSGDRIGGTLSTILADQHQLLIYKRRTTVRRSTGRPASHVKVRFAWRSTTSPTTRSSAAARRPVTALISPNQPASPASPTRSSA